METFEEVLKQFEPMIYSCIRKLRIYKEYTEFIQVGRVGLWKAWKNYDEERGDFAPFAYRTIYGSMLDELKKSYAIEQYMVPTDNLIVEHLIGSCAKSVSNNDIIYEALTQLKESEYQLIQLLFLQGYNLDEVALQMGISKACLKKKRHRTLKKLKILMKQDTQTNKLV